MAVVGVAVVFAVGAKGKDKGDTKIETAVGKAEIADVQVEVTEIGTVEPEIRVDVKSVLSGKVVSLPVREGDVVRKGQLLAAIEPDVNQAQTLAAVRRASTSRRSTSGRREGLPRQGGAAQGRARSRWRSTVSAETRYKSAAEALSRGTGEGRHHGVLGRPG